MTRQTPEGTVASIEVLRGVAIIMLLFQHLPDLLPQSGYWWLPGQVLSNFNMSAGVDIFFCVSGFVVTRSLLRHLVSCTRENALEQTARFWARQAFRLWPAAWLWLFIAYLVSRYFNSSGFMHPAADLRLIPAGIGLYSNYLFLHEAHRHQDLGVMSQFWGLSFLEQSYIALPLLLIFVRRLTLPLLIAYCAFRFYAYHDFWADVFLRPGCLVAGVLLAHLEGGALWRRLQAVPLGAYVRATLCILLIALLAAINATGPFDRLAGVPMFRLQAPLATATGFCLVLLVAQAPGLAGAGRAAYILSFVGRRSYILSLTHQVVYAAAREAVFRMFPGPEIGVGKAVCTGAIALFALVITTELTARYVEQPWRARGRIVADRIQLGVFLDRLMGHRHALGSDISASGGQTTGKPRRVVDIEALRTIAIAFVLVQHVDNNLLFWPYKLQWLLTWGQLWPGVDLFFVISGFLVTSDLLRRMQSASLVSDLKVAGRFWFRRAWRLWPTAWFWLMLIVAGSACFHDLPFLGPIKANIKGAFAGIFLYANYRSSTTIWEPYGSSFAYWSLSLEEQFYVLLPLAVMLLGRYLPVAVCLGIAVQFPLAHGRTYQFFRSDALLWGVALSLAYKQSAYWRLEPTLLRSRMISAPVILLCLLAVFRLAGQGNVSPPFVIGSIAAIAAVLVWLASYDRGYICPKWARQFALWGGSRSYALYVAHVPVFNLSAAFAHYVFTPRFHPFTGAGNPYALAAVVPLMLLSVEFTHRCVEQPLRTIGSRLADRIFPPA